MYVLCLVKVVHYHLKGMRGVCGGEKESTVVVVCVCVCACVCVEREGGEMDDVRPIEKKENEESYVVSLK